MMGVIVVLQYRGAPLAGFGVITYPGYKVFKQVFATKNFSSVLGTFSIDQNGDTTLTDYGGDRVKGGKLVFDKVIKAQGL